MGPSTGDATQQTEEYLDLADGILQGANGNPSNLRGYLASLLQQSDATGNEMRELRRLVAAKQRDNRALATGLVEERRQREELEEHLIALRAKIEGSGVRRLPLSMPETMAVVRDQADRLLPETPERQEYQNALDEVSHQMLRLLPMVERSLDSTNEREVAAAAQFIESIHFRLRNRAASQQHPR